MLQAPQHVVSSPMLRTTYEYPSLLRNFNCFICFFGALAQLSESEQTVLTRACFCILLSQGSHRFGSRGNMEALRTLSNPRYKNTTRSNPMPAPPCGGTPCRKAFT